MIARLRSERGEISLIELLVAISIFALVLGANAANVKRERWCLDDGDPKNEKLYIQDQTWTDQDTPAMPSTSACPGGGWNTTMVMASNLTNKYNGLSRPLFTFDTSDLSAID